MNDPRKMLADMNRTAADSLAQAAEGLGDKIDWKPLDKGRSALDQVQECAGMAVFGAQIMETQSVPPFDSAVFEKFRKEYASPDKAVALLRDATERFATAIEAFPTEKLNDKVTLPFGPNGMEKSFGEVAMMAYWNTVYHEGQVNYIQTLCAE
jgi:hypothetical protein